VEREISQAFETHFSGLKTQELKERAIPVNGNLICGAVRNNMWR